MRKFNFESVEDLCVEALKAYDLMENDEDFYGINIVAHYDIIVAAMNWLAENTIFKLFCINIEPPEIDLYYDEYILSLQDEGLWCERARKEEKYLTVNEPTFVHSDCNSQFVVRNKGCAMYEFSIDEYDDEYACCCPNCGSEDYVLLSKDEDGNTNGFTRSWSDGNSYCSYSFYSSDAGLVRAELNKFKN